MIGPPEGGYGVIAISEEEERWLMSEMTKKKTVLVIAHGDLDGIMSAALEMKRSGLSVAETQVIFTQPFLIDKIVIPESIEKIFVVDIAVNNRDTMMTEKFIEQIRDKNRLVAWYDHHEGWEKVLGTGMGQTFDNGFFIDPMSRSCAELIDPGNEEEEFVAWVADANASDTREGELSERGQLVEQAMKANLSDDSVREAAVRWIVNGCREDSDYEILRLKQAEYQRVQKITEKLVKQYEIHDGVAVVDVRDVSEDYDRTQLLLKGEQMAFSKTAIVLGKNPEGEEVITVATMDKQRNLVNLFGLPSGAPFRVSLPVAAGWTVERVLKTLSQ